MYNTIFTVSLSVLLALFVGLGLLFGRKYKWYYSLARVGTAIASGIGSFFLSSMLAKHLGDVGYDILIKNLPSKITDYVKDLPSAPDVFGALVTIILSPIFFVALFFIFKAILNCIIKNVCISAAKKKALSAATPIESIEEAQTAEPDVQEAISEEIVSETVVEVTEEIEDGKKKIKKKKKIRVKAPKKMRRIDFIRAKGVNPAGMVCGVVCGLITFFIIAVPFVGTATVADRVLGLVSKYIADETVATVTEVTDAAAQNPISRAVGAIGGRYIFDKLTTTELGDHELSLDKEVELVTSAGNAVMSTINNNVPREQAADDLRHMSAAFSDSSLVPTLAPELLAAANTSWEKGESFYGIKKISVSGKANTVVAPLIDILAHSDYDSIKTDADTLIEILAILVEQDGINVALKNPKSIPENEAMTAPVIYELLQNEHFSTLLEAAAELGVQYVGGQFHLHASKDALYDEFAAAAAAKTSAVIAAGFEDASDKLTLVYSDLFDDYGLNVSAEGIAALTALTLERYPDGKITAENMKVLLSELTLPLKDGGSVKLDSAEALASASLLVCIDDIHFDVSSVTDKEVESRKLATAIHEVLSLTTMLKTGAFEDASSIQKLGPILDALSGSEIMGEKNTEQLLTGILQSDIIHDQIGFSLIGATDVASTICGKSHANGYAPLLKSLSDTVEIVQLTTKDTASKEELTAKVEVLLDDLTPESAEVLQKITTSEVMISQGVPEQSAEPVSNLVSNMFGNLASAKDNGMSDEDYKKEAAATSNLLNMALASTSSGKNIFADVPDETPVTPPEGGDGENGGNTPETEPAPSTASSMTAAEYIDSVMNSTVISQTIVDATFTEDSSEEPMLDPLNMGKTLTEKEQTQVLDSLNQHWANASDEEKADSEYFKKYAAIGAMVNFPVTVGPDGSIVAVAGN